MDKGLMESIGKMSETVLELSRRVPDLESKNKALHLENRSLRERMEILLQSVKGLEAENKELWEKLDAARKKLISEKARVASMVSVLAEEVGLSKEKLFKRADEKYRIIIERE